MAIFNSSRARYFETGYDIDRLPKFGVSYLRRPIQMRPINHKYTGFDTAHLIFNVYAERRTSSSSNEKKVVEALSWLRPLGVYPFDLPVSKPLNRQTHTARTARPDVAPCSMISTPHSDGEKEMANTCAALKVFHPCS